MLPSSLLGLGVLLCLIPGLLYARLIEHARHPREDSALLEAVEVLAMGLVSIGLVVGPWVLLAPEGVRTFTAEPHADLRVLVYVVALLVFGSVGVAYCMAQIRLLRYRKRYTPTVWTKTFDEYRPGFVREVMVELADLRAYQGTLHAYTLDPSVEQQITISSPIKRVDGERDEELGQERMAFSGGQIRSVSLAYTPAGLDEDGAPLERGWFKRLRETAAAAGQAAAEEWGRARTPDQGPIRAGNMSRSIDASDVEGRRRPAEVSDGEQPSG